MKTLMVFLALMLGLAGFGLTRAVDSKKQIICHWAPYVAFDGVVYHRIPAESFGRSVSDKDVGPFFDDVKVRPKCTRGQKESVADGEATHLPIGERFYTVTGYHPTTTLARRVGPAIEIYLATRNERSRRLSDEVDTGPGVRYIGITRNDGGPEIAVKEPREIDAMVSLVMNARRERPDEKYEYDTERVSLILYLRDGTFRYVGYDLDLGLLRGRFRPAKSLGVQVRQLLNTWPPPPAR